MIYLFWIFGAFCGASLGACGSDLRPLPEEGERSGPVTGTTGGAGDSGSDANAGEETSSGGLEGGTGGVGGTGTGGVTATGGTTGTGGNPGSVEPLQAFLEVQPPNPVPGEQVLAKIVLSSVDTVLEDGVLTLTLPDGIASLSASNDVSSGGSVGSGQVSWAEVNLAKGESKVFWVRMVLGVGGGAPSGPLQYRMKLVEGLATWVNAPLSVPVYAEPGLTLALTSSATPARPEDRIRYELHYGNRSGAGRSSVTATLVLPDQVSYLASTVGEYDAEQHRITIPLGRLGAGEAGSAIVDVLVGKDARPGAVLHATAKLDTGSEMLLVHEHGTVGDPALRFDVLLESSELNYGESQRLLMAVTNPGDNEVGAQLELLLSNSGGQESPRGEGVECAQFCSAGDTLRWNIDSIAPHTTKLQWFRTSTKISVEAGELYPYGALLALDDQTVSGTSQWQSFGAHINNSPGLDVRIDGPSAPVVAGGDIRYVVHYSNRGEDAVGSARLAFLVPVGAAHSSGEEMVEYDLGALAAGATGELSVALQADSDLDADSVLSAQAEIYQVDKRHVSVRAHALTIVQEPGVEVVAMRTPVESPIQTVMDVSVQVTNRGTQSRFATITVQLPEGLYQLSSSAYADGGECWGNWCDPEEDLQWQGESFPVSVPREFWVRPTVSVGAEPGSLMTYGIHVQPDVGEPFWATLTSRVDSNP